VSADGRGLVSQARAVLLCETMRVTGLARGLSAGLARWRAPRAVHDPGKVIADLRLRLAERWPWAGEIAAAVTRLQALPSVLPVPTATMTRKGNTRAAEPRPPGATARHPGMGDARTSTPAEHLRPGQPSHETSRLDSSCDPPTMRKPPRPAHRGRCCMPVAESPVPAPVDAFQGAPETIWIRHRPLRGVGPIGP